MSKRELAWQVWLIDCHYYYWQGLVSASMLPLSFSPRTAMRLVLPSLHGSLRGPARGARGTTGTDLGMPSNHVFASRILPLAAHHDSRPAAALRLPRPTRRPQQYIASIEISRVAPCNRGCDTTTPIGADAEGHKPPGRKQSAECRARSPQRWVLGVGYRLPAVVIHGAGPAAPGLCRWRSSFFLWVGCVLSQICLSAVQLARLETRQLKGR
jgi:hypothetical protein